MCSALHMISEPSEVKGEKRVVNTSVSRGMVSGKTGAYVIYRSFNIIDSP